MQEEFLKRGIYLTEEKLGKFAKFKDLLLEFNEKFNLTAIKTEKEIYIKHFVDSLIAVDKFKKLSTVIEIGSGGGFPSIPLKIVRDDLEFTLIEATGKKCEFLKTVVKELGLEKVTVINARAEELGKEEKYREKFDYATARAVARLNVLSEYCMPFLKVGGKFIAYKGNAEEELIEAENAVSVLGGRIDSAEKYYLSDGGDERTIIEIEKVRKTPEKYPRGNGKERKNPL